MQILWLLVDVVVGVLLAGIVAPPALVALPEPVRGPNVLMIVGVTCIVIVMSPETGASKVGRMILLHFSGVGP